MIRIRYRRPSSMNGNFSGDRIYEGNQARTDTSSQRTYQSSKDGMNIVHKSRSRALTYPPLSHESSHNQDNKKYLNSISDNDCIGTTKHSMSHSQSFNILNQEALEAIEIPLNDVPDDSLSSVVTATANPHDPNSSRNHVKEEPIHSMNHSQSFLILNQEALEAIEIPLNDVPDDSDPNSSRNHVEEEPSHSMNYSQSFLILNQEALEAIEITSTKDVADEVLTATTNPHDPNSSRNHVKEVPIPDESSDGYQFPSVEEENEYYLRYRTGVLQHYHNTHRDESFTRFSDDTHVRPSHPDAFMLLKESATFPPPPSISFGNIFQKNDSQSFNVLSQFSSKNERTSFDDNVDGANLSPCFQQDEDTDGNNQSVPLPILPSLPSQNDLMSVGASPPSVAMVHSRTNQTETMQSIRDLGLSSLLEHQEFARQSPYYCSTGIDSNIHLKRCPKPTPTLVLENYPELNSCLIEHNEEYLRHTVSISTTQLGTFLDQITEQLCKLAMHHEYDMSKYGFDDLAVVKERIFVFYKNYNNSQE